MLVLTVVGVGCLLGPLLVLTVAAVAVGLAGLGVCSLSSDCEEGLHDGLRTRPEEMDVELAMLDAELTEVGRTSPTDRRGVERATRPHPQPGSAVVVGPAERTPCAAGRARRSSSRQRPQLERIRTTSIRFDRVAMPTSWTPRPCSAPAAAVERGARPCSDNIARLVVGRTPPHGSSELPAPSTTHWVARWRRWDRA